MNNSFIERITTGSGNVARKLDYIVDNGKPLDFVDGLARSIPNKLAELSEPPRGAEYETAADKEKREKLIRDYTKLLTMVTAEKGLLFAARELDKIENPERYRE
jgi:hypothetical protein